MTWDEAIKVGLTILGSLGGSGLIILGLSNWLGKVWAKRIIADHEAMIKEKLETHIGEVKKSLKHVEFGHNISQETFSELFKKKKEVYEKLIEIKTKYTKETSEEYAYVFHDYPAWPFLELFNDLREVIEKNRILVSDEISKKYDKIYPIVAEYLVEKEEGEAHAQTYFNEKDRGKFFEQQLDTEDDLSRKLREKTHSEMMELLKQIEEDSSKFRKILEMAFKS